MVKNNDFNQKKFNNFMQLLIYNFLATKQAIIIKQIFLVRVYGWAFLFIKEFVVYVIEKILRNCW